MKCELCGCVLKKIIATMSLSSFKIYKIKDFGACAVYDNIQVCLKCGKWIAKNRIKNGWGNENSTQ